MLESKQHSVFWNFLDFQVHNPVPGLLKYWVTELIFLFSPQDTAGKFDQGKRKVENQAGNTRGIVKVLFWVIISIVLSLALGQLN